MHHNYDLSIVMPGVRQQNWELIYEQTKSACKKYSYEFVICSPYPLPPKLQSAINVKYIKDFGHPSRALQMGATLSEGKYITWFSDDAWINENSIDLALDLLLSKDPYKDVILMRYSEGRDRSAPEFPLSYWTPAPHADMRAPGVNLNWLCTGVAMFNYDYYRYLGGIDCHYEHTNMNMHDLGFRAQKNGSVVYYSPTVVQNCDWVPEQAQSDCFVECDRPRFHAHYADNSRPVCISFDSWRDCHVVWHRKKHLYM